MGIIIMNRQIDQIDIDAENQGKAIKQHRYLTPHSVMARDTAKNIRNRRYTPVDILTMGWLERQMRKQRKIENGYEFRL